jgi:hypothetical protein
MEDHENVTPITMQTLCPLCWRPETTKVEGDLPCVTCQEGMKKGFLCIGVDFSKSETTDKAIRTGHRWVISKEAARELYKDSTIETGAGLLDIEEARALGLPIQTSGYTVAKEAAKDQPKAPDRIKCSVCGKAIEKDDLGGIDPVKGFMHKGCTPLTLV